MPLPVQYADYTLWQSANLGDERDPTSAIARQIEWWHKALAGVPDRIRLPFDSRGERGGTGRGAVAPLRLSKSLHRALLQIALAHRVSLFMILQAAFATVLTRYGAGSDVPIGTPLGNRPDAALEDAVGCFVNMVALRTDTSGNPSFADSSRACGAATSTPTIVRTPFDRCRRRPPRISFGRAPPAVPGHAHDAECADPRGAAARSSRVAAPRRRPLFPIRSLADRPRETGARRRTGRV